MIPATETDVIRIKDAQGNEVVIPKDPKNAEYLQYVRERTTPPATPQ